MFSGNYDYRDKHIGTINRCEAMWFQKWESNIYLMLIFLLQTTVIMIFGDGNNIYLIFVEFHL